MLTARGVLEFYEKKCCAKMPSYLRTGNREKKWEWIFNNDKGFYNKIISHIHHSINANSVGVLASEVFSNSSVEIHRFKKQNGVEIDRDDYTSDQRRSLRALCATIPCTLKEI